MKKPRNAELASILKNNPSALQTKIREGEKRKEKFVRSKKKIIEKKEIENEIGSITKISS